MHIDFSILEVQSVAVALLISLGILALGWPIGERLGVVDHPDNGRKNHARATPLVGGIAIMVPLLLWSAAGFFWPDLIGGTPIPRAVLICGGGAALVGFSPSLKHIVFPTFELAPIVFGENWTCPASYSDPTFCCHAPWTAARTRRAETERTSTVWDVGLSALAVACSSYGWLFAPVGQV